ncbi:SRPBCC family protein [Amycolatopsis sp. K13G38]|uniref:SRPBCC family protein n=1 Tax=Amycolatopsis acididurans TaxID=2724524 RepID=A0ABX1JJ08_9PSEU|nr:SRPBCC family protein [Amycolatopsis acididurans]NKQ59344.1 SRPBCC family protein [Amycolatopsis acididurans]
MRVVETLVMAADPDTVWKIGGDTANIASWVPAIEKSHQSADVRHATFAGGGGEAAERIVEHDNAARSYVYEYLSGPLALRSYRSRFTVRDHAEGAEVVWDAEFEAENADEEPALADAIRGIYRAALASLSEKSR